MFDFPPRWLRRLHRPAGLGLAAVLPALLLGSLFWYEAAGYKHFSDFPKELTLLSGEMVGGNFLRKHGRGTVRRDDLVFLGIDDATLRLDGLWPDELEASSALKLMSEAKGPGSWSRAVYASLLDRLTAAGARLVIFDLVFPRPDPGDETFRAALDRHRDRVVIGSQFVQTPGDKALEPPAATLLPEATNDPRVGYVNFDADFDGSIRLLLFRTTAAAYNGRAARPADPVHDSLVSSALRQLGRTDLIPPGREPRLFRYTDLLHGAHYVPRPLWEVFSDATWKGNYQEGAFFKDKIVMVGAAAPILQDYQPTPYGRIPGPELHLQALTAALSGEYLRLTSVWTDFGLIAAAGVLAWGVGVGVRQPLVRLGAFAAGSVAFVGGLQFLYNRHGLMPLAFTPLLVFNTGGLGGLIAEYVVERAEKARVRGVLDRLVSKDIVRELLADRDRYAELVRGQRRCVTVLFSDVRGFTTLTEDATDPVAFIVQLNEYLGEMVDVVFKHRGTLDKFIGDAVMAVWGSLHSEGEDADACLAVAAALEMRERLTALNARWHAEGRLPLSIGIGVNHGEVIVGGLGSEQSKMEITVMGDAVNTASRLEGLTKEYGIDLLVGESVASRVRGRFRLRTVDLVRVKGKTRPTEVMAVLGPLTEASPSSPHEQLLADYEAAVRLYRARDFAGAAHRLEACLRVNPEDRLCALYLSRCRELLVNAPTAEWDGVRLMISK